MAAIVNPKVFISYSWTSPSHQEWVIRLATELMASGCEVILDKWDLKEGHDAIAFMEAMVTDTTVSKVLLISDRVYAEKADKRTGGVGTEAQIISAKIYESQRQDKFVAVVAELDNDGIAYLPVYYKSRIYIDMSTDEKYAERLEQLLRWIYNKPLVQKPEIGRPPAFLTESTKSNIGVATPFQRRALQAVHANPQSPLPAVVDYFDKLQSLIGDLPTASDGDQLDDVVVENINAFSSPRSEYIDLVESLCRYVSGERLVDVLVEGIERFVPHMHRPPNVQQWREGLWDGRHFVTSELFLYTIAALLKNGKFKETEEILNQEYYFEQNPERSDGKMVSYDVFRSHLRSLSHRAERLKNPDGSKRTSIHADLLKERAIGLSITFSQLMQADFTLYLRGELGVGPRWWPVTLLYSSRNGPFEMYARSKSARFFEKLKSILGAASGDDFRVKMRERITQDNIPKWGWHAVEVWDLSGAALIATSP